jgi:nucleoside-diphosphate-sugar epimerase
MFADPQSVTINAVAQSMPRVSSKDRSAVYQKNDLSYTLSISHTAGAKGRVRTLVRIDQRAVVTNPLDSSNDYDTLTYYIVLDRPSYGFTMVQAEQLVAGFNAWLTSGNVDKLWGQES